VRDCGYSVPLPDTPQRSLWLFCDTYVTSRHGTEIGSPILGADTAAEGPYTPGQAPDTLTEVPAPGQNAAPGAPADARKQATASTAPQAFLPLPQNLTLPGTGLPCSGPRDYQARWISGVASDPASSGQAGQVLISYVDYCVSGTSQFTAEAFGLVGYDPATGVLGDVAQVFAVTGGQQMPPQWQLGSPVFRDGYLYLFGSCAPHQSCGSAGVFVARTAASPANWQDGLTYQYWTGSG
jgi:hypothetical protein